MCTPPFGRFVSPSTACVVLVVVASAALPRAASAVPFQLTIEGVEAVDFALRDVAGDAVSFAAEDDDGDLRISLVVDIEPADPGRAVYMHVGQGELRSRSICWILTSPGLPGAPPTRDSFVLFTNDTDERVLARWAAAPEDPLPLGQLFDARDGRLPGLDVMLHRVEIDSALELLDLDVEALPLYSGPARVAARLTVQGVPEPGTAALLALGWLGAALRNRVGATAARCSASACRGSGGEARTSGR